jgi:hypothetical protein
MCLLICKVKKMLFFSFLSKKLFSLDRGAGGQGLKTRDVREIEEVDILPIENLTLLYQNPAKNH